MVHSRPWSEEGKAVWWVDLPPVAAIRRRQHLWRDKEVISPLYKEAPVRWWKDPHLRSDTANCRGWPTRAPLWWNYAYALCLHLNTYPHFYTQAPNVRSLLSTVQSFLLSHCYGPFWAARSRSEGSLQVPWLLYQHIWCNVGLGNGRHGTQTIGPGLGSQLNIVSADLNPNYV